MPGTLESWADQAPGSVPTRPALQMHPLLTLQIRAGGQVLLPAPLCRHQLRFAEDKELSGSRLVAERQGVS